MNKKSKKVLVGMSGGVDSAVAAYLLLQQGYEVIAGFMKNYADEENPNCHTREDRNMALKVSQSLGIKTFIIFDFREEYNQRIIQYIYDGYKAGLTPNPDVLCNSLVKFDLFLQKALELGCDFVATGHYARISSIKGAGGIEHFNLHKGVDSNKDQSYFLSGLNQHQLAHALFPLGELTKPQVRTIAKEAGLPNAERKDSQGLCFIGKVSMKAFLKEVLPVKTGDIIDTQGTVLGHHEGAWFHTLGQRQGLGLAGGPRYVIQKDVTTNTLVVGKEDEQELFTQQLTATQRHWIDNPKNYPLPFNAYAKIRYRQEDQKITVKQGATEQNLLIDFDQPQRAVSAGQVVVVYQGDTVVGSGIIT